MKTKGVNNDMQKSKIATILVIGMIILYTGLRVTIFSTFGWIYTYLINPLFWIILAITLYKVLGKTYENQKFKKEIIEYTLIACLVYILVYLISGLFVTFGKNPYARTIKGILTNLWILGTVIAAREYIRYKLINNVYEKEKKTIAILVTVVFTLIEFEFWKLIGKELSIYYIFTQIFEYLIPILAKNILYTYLALNHNYSSAIVYEMLTNLYLWISPILPNSPWVMDAIIDTTIPIILFLYIRYTKNKLDKFRSKEKIINSDPRNIIPLVIVVILAIWFAIGIFPIKPVAIASGSMEKELYVGDVAIIKKCTPNDVNVGDIIEYQMEGYTVIHRIVEKTQRKGTFYFKTKGDNNEVADKKEVTEDQLIGKVIFKIKYLGYPAIWLHNLQEQEQIEVET